MFGSSQTNREGPKLKAIDSILAGLGELPMAERVTQLGNVLATIESVSLTGRKRIQVLEACRDPVLAVIEDTRQSCIVQSLPIGDTEFKRINLALNLIAHLAVLYAKTDGDGDKSKKILRLVAHRELELRENYLVMAALAYIPLPENFWLCVHATVSRIDRDNLIKFKPPGSDNRLSLTTGQLYVALILIGQADPYQLAFREVLRVREVATLLANRVEIITDSFQVEPEKKRYVFLVDGKLNQPAMPWGTGRDGQLAPGNMVLDVTDVITRLRRTYRSLKPHAIKFDATFPDEPKVVIMAFYEHVLMLWAKQPIRTNERSTKISGFQLCVGLEDMLTLPAAKSISSGAASEDEIVLSGGLDADSKMVASFLDARSHDVSKDGVRFVVTGSTQKRIAAGEVVAYCSEENGEWMVGLIRWIKGPTSGRAEFGVAALGEFSDIAVIPEIESDESVDDLPALAKSAVLIRDVLHRPENYWIVEAIRSEDREVTGPDTEQVLIDEERRYLKPLNRQRRTPFVVYQYVELLDAAESDVVSQTQPVHG